jgi:hypothetical protein
MPDQWTCPECATANRASSVVCGNCGHVRPDLDRTQPYTTVPPQDNRAAAMAAAGGIPGWTPTGQTTDDVVPDPSVEAHVPDPAVAPPPEMPTPPDWSAPPTAQLADPGAIAGWSAAAPQQLPLWRRIPVGWLVVGLFVLVGAIAGWYFNASRSGTGEITRAGDLQANELRVGDCFDVKDESADTIDDVRAIPCTSEHKYELFFVGALPDGDYPGDAAFDNYVTDNCGSAFGSYVGKAFDDSALEVYWLQPTDDAWRSGDHVVQCAVWDPSRERLTQSLKGSQL